MKESDVRTICNKDLLNLITRLEKDFLMKELVYQIQLKDIKVMKNELLDRSRIDNAMKTIDDIEEIAKVSGVSVDDVKRHIERSDDIAQTDNLNL